MSRVITVALLLLVVGVAVWATFRFKRAEFRTWQARRRKASGETTDYYGQM